MPINKLTIATRNSPLALWQSQQVYQLLAQQYPSMTIELLPLKTQGDLLLDTSLSKLGGKGLFIKELEVALLEQHADLAVHSMKDVPAILPESFALPAILKRGSVEDAFVSTEYAAFNDLPTHATVGTSSLRRQSQLLYHRPDLVIEPIRGNLQTRLKKLNDTPLAAIILACAGLERLDMHAQITERFPTDTCLPAIGQGAIGIECLKTRPDLINLLRALNDTHTEWAVWTERALNKALGGDCQSPIAGHAVIKPCTADNTVKITLKGLVASPDGSQRLFNQQEITLSNTASKTPETLFKTLSELGQSVAEALRQQGAQAILDAIKLK